MMENIPSRNKARQPVKCIIFVLERDILTASKPRLNIFCSYSAIDDDDDERFNKKFARSNASANAVLAPFPACVVIGCAASPSNVTRGLAGNGFCFKHSAEC